MVVNRPLRENHVGLFRFEQSPKCVVVGLVYHGLAVGFICEPGMRLQNFARSLRFGRASCCACFRGLARTALLAAVEVEKRDFVAKVAVLGDCSAAAVFRIAGMTTVTATFNFLAASKETKAGELARKTRRES
jgi:hypothetical protein